MIEKIESIKDTLQSAVDNGTERLERIHNMIADYAAQNGWHVSDALAEWLLANGIGWTAGPYYLFTLSAGVLVSAAYLFRMYWIAMTNIRYANR